MVLIQASDVGRGAWWRLTHDGAIVPLTAHRGHAADIERSPALRAASLAKSVPRRAVMSGLAALWVHGWRAPGPSPQAIEVAVPRGCHPGAPPDIAAGTWSFVTDQAATRQATLIGGVAIASPEHAVASALARAPLSVALDAAWWALTVALVEPTAVRTAMRANASGTERSRATSAWNALCAASGAR